MPARSVPRAKALSYPLRPLSTGAVVWRSGAAVLLLVAAIAWLHANPVQAQTPAATAPAHGAGATAGGAAAGSSAPAAAKPAAPSLSKPLWASLTAEQKSALQPLSPYWDGISEPHKRKWLAMSRNFSTMKPEDQATVRSRMTEWAALSPQQRAQARLNFAEVKQLPVDERKAKWEAYQALSDDEKRKLADSARTRPPSAAMPIRPVPAQKLAPVPALSSAVPRGEHTPRIQLAPPPTAALSATPASSARAAAETAPTPTPATVSSPPVPAEAQVPDPSGPAPAAPTTE